MLKNNEDVNIKDSDHRDPYYPVNSLDYTVYVERLNVNQSIAKGIYLYGTDNLYPQKVKAIAQRSNSLETALETLSQFTFGQGVEGVEDFQVNENGLTFYELLKHSIIEKSSIGFAIHCKYNRFGQIAEFTPINFEFVRKKVKTETDKYPTYILSNNWENSNFLNEFKSVEVYAFDPENAKTQIDEVGFENYTGQLFYWHRSNDIYGLAKYDSVLDDAQLEAESKLYSLSNTQNGFSVSGIFKYPVNIDSVNKKSEYAEKMKKTKSPINAGRILTVPYSPQSPPPSNLWESITLPNVDEMFVNQNENAKKNIYEKFQQPGIINGRSDSGMFNAQSMQDAFDFYNSKTEYDRKEVERAYNTLFEWSIFNVPKIEIIPLSFLQITEESNKDGNAIDND